MRKVLVILFLVVATLGLYAPSWSNPFVLDDMTKIQENNDLKTPFRLSNFIYPYADNRMHFRNDPSRPLTYILYWICWHAGDGSPAAFHATSTILHATAAVLIFLLATNLAFVLFGTPTVWPGAGAALLFITSPILAGTAVYAFGMSDVLSAVLVLATLILLFDGETRGRRVAGLVVFVLAVAAKQSAVVALPLVMAMDLFTGRSSRKRVKTVYLPLAAITIAYLMTRWLYFGGIGDLEAKNETFPLWLYLPLQGVMIWKYLAQMFVPLGLAIDHKPLPDIPLWVGYVGWAAIAFATYFAISSRKILGWGWLFFLITLLPVSSLLPTVDLYVERRAYLAAAGIFVALALFVWSHIQNRSRARAIAAVALGLVAAAQAAYAWQRADLYGSVEGLWRESLSEDPRNPRALINLGVYYSLIGRWDDSRKVLEDLLLLQPMNGAVYSKLAYIYQQKNYEKHDSRKAYEYFKKALELDSSNIFAHFNLGVLFMERREFAAAEAEFLEAVKHSPQFTRALVAAGQAALADHRPDQAAQHFRDALSVDPSLELAKQLLASLGRPQ